MSHDRKNGVRFTKGSGLNFGKGKRALLHSFVPKGKEPDHYHRTQRGLGYISMPVLSDFKSEEEVYHDNLSAALSWDSDVSVGGIFERLSVNMVLASHLKDDEEGTFNYEELIQSDSDP